MYGSGSNASLSLVGSADIIVWPESASSYESQEYFVEIKVDNAKVSTTQAVNRDKKRLTWNKKILM
jgi:apolipoprotein N-acyltransferase